MGQPVATIRERHPGVWEVRVFTGRGTDGKPTQTSRTVRGGKHDAMWGRVPQTQLPWVTSTYTKWL